MNLRCITKEQARQFLIRYQGLDGRGTFSGEAGILEFMRRVGCIQYDPLDVVGRNADLVLQARIPGYRREILEKLLYTERTLLDGWDKMASILLTEDWPCFHRLREQRREGIVHVLRHRDTLDALSLKEEVLSGLREKGPALSTQLKMGKAGNINWGHRNLSGAAMDYLFNVGEIGIKGKRGTQRIYDLIEHLLPETLLHEVNPFVDEDAFVKWYVSRRIGSIGMLWARNGGGWLGHFLQNKARRSRVILALVSENLLQEIRVDGIPDPFYIRTGDLPILDAENIVEATPSAHVLAPLDNLIWDRDMTMRLFDFQYSWEVYVPAEKRKYGYYVLPVLLGDHIVARFEPEPQRGDTPLTVKNWWWEKGLIPDARMKTAVHVGMKQFAGYLGTKFDGRTIR